TLQLFVGGLPVHRVGAQRYPVSRFAAVRQAQVVRAARPADRTGAALAGELLIDVAVDALHGAIEAHQRGAGFARGGLRGIVLRDDALPFFLVAGRQLREEPLLERADVAL